jgi:arsenate reductase-like glutaredoxin family protein
MRSYVEKNPTQKELVEWLKVKSLSSRPSIEKKKKKLRILSNLQNFGTNFHI